MNCKNRSNYLNIALHTKTFLKVQLYKEESGYCFLVANSSYFFLLFDSNALFDLSSDLIHI